MNLNTCEVNSNSVPNPYVLELTAEKNFDAIKELALLSCVALVFIHEETEALTEDQVAVIKSCEELVESLAITDDGAVVALAFKHINAYIVAKEKQKLYFCADSAKAAKPLH